jgi:myo-inositol-1(or 4)-monophosphatase
MSKVPSHDDLLACAVEAAGAAGNHALANLHRRNEVAQRYAHDVKLHLDLECQKKAEEVIRNAFPSHPVLGEEGGSFDAAAELLWIVDPIDGTVNFMHGLPLWCSSVAMRAGGEVVAGAVYLPVMKECFTAMLGRPAMCNDEPIHSSETESLADAIVLTGLSKNIGENLRTFDVLKAVSMKVQKARIMGAAAVDICYVACGRADAYIEAGIFLWDIAAAGLIARQAGARTDVIEKISDVRYQYLCANGKIYDALREVVVGVLAK